MGDTGVFCVLFFSNVEEYIIADMARPPKVKRRGGEKIGNIQYSLSWEQIDLSPNRNLLNGDQKMIVKLLLNLRQIHC